MMPQNLILLLFGVSEAANKMHFMSAHRPRELQSSSGIISTADERYEGTGGECVFPFIYRGQTFHQCAPDGDWFWCSTQTDSDGVHVSGGNHWGWCPDVCSLTPGVVGKCRAAFPRFTYNNDTGSCERFIYGGCGGNENNFSSETECNRKCATPEIQTLPPINNCACDKIYDPVCGTDGNTYDNSCLAVCAKTSVANEGQCAIPEIRTLPPIRIAGIISTPDLDATPTAKGGPCVSPFIFESQQFDKCVRDGDWSWCSTKTDSNGVHVSGEGNWGWCPAGTMPQIFTDSVIGGSNGKNQKCIFPFRFSGTNYYDCAPPTSTDVVNRKWCSTKTDENNNHVGGDGNWGYCI